MHTISLILNGHYSETISSHYDSGISLDLGNLESKSLSVFHQKVPDDGDIDTLHKWARRNEGDVSPRGETDVVRGVYVRKRRKQEQYELF